MDRNARSILRRSSFRALHELESVSDSLMLRDVLEMQFERKGGVNPVTVISHCVHFCFDCNDSLPFYYLRILKNIKKI